MKPEKRPASKIPRVRRAKKAVPVMFGAAPIMQGDVYVRDGATLSLRRKELNYIQWLKTKYLLIGMLIGLWFGYGLHSAVTWLH